MKVLHINCNYLGTTLHQNMIEKLDENNIENVVFVPVHDNNIASIIPNSNVIVSECFNKYDRIIFDYKQSKIIRSIKEKCILSDFNCIHAYTLFTDGNVAMHLSKEFGIPYIVTIRNTDVNVFLKHMIHLRGRALEIMKNAKYIVFLSNAYKNQVFNQYIPTKLRDVLSRKSLVIPNGIDAFWLSNHPKKLNQKITPVEDVRLIYAGRIDKNKNIPTIQKAMKLLRKKNINASLTVVGKVEDIKEFKKIIDDKNTCYLKAIPKEELVKLYRESDIFVMPSYTESFGLVYAEALSQGIPVVYTKGQGFDGQFAEGQVGYSIDANSPSEVCDSIIKIIRDYNRFPEICVQASKKFDWNNLVKEYIEIYRNLK